MGRWTGHRKSGGASKVLAGIANRIYRCEVFETFPYVPACHDGVAAEQRSGFLAGGFVMATLLGTPARTPLCQTKHIP